MAGFRKLMDVLNVFSLRKLMDVLNVSGFSCVAWGAGKYGWFQKINGCPKCFAKCFVLNVLAGFRKLMDVLNVSFQKINGCPKCFSLQKINGCPKCFFCSLQCLRV